jgi:hypothetical protein
MGSWTRAAPELYPHQWSWDSAFIAIGLAHLDVRRAALELRTLFAHQWATGKVPHIVFNPELRLTAIILVQNTGLALRLLRMLPRRHRIPAA